MSAEILIVDDNADIRNIINELIIDAGYKTRIAANYNQALAEIDKKLPDVAIIDVKLDKGDNDGIELLSHIKTKNKDVPVIIISGHANIEMAVKSLQHGAFEFIEKPFDQERLLNFVKRAVENFNLKKQNKEYESKLFSSYELIGNSKNILNIIDQKLVLSAHDVSDGGVLVCIAEMAMIGDIGATIHVPEINVPAHAWLFGEDQSRYVVSTNDTKKLLNEATNANVPAMQIGITGGQGLSLLSGTKETPVNTLRNINESWLPEFMDGV